jgi:lipoate-protein ligase A
MLQEGVQNFCMARPTQYDVVSGGLKIAGSAQRKTRRGYLHQGTISLAPPDVAFLQTILKTDVTPAMSTHSFAPVPLEELDTTRHILAQNLQAVLSERLQ